MKLLCAQVIKDILGGSMDVGVFKHDIFVSVIKKTRVGIHNNLWYTYISVRESVQVDSWCKIW